MANTFYVPFKEALFNGDIDLDTDDIRAVFIDLNDYTPNFTTDEFLDDIPGGALVGTATALAGKTITAGVFDANDTNITAVTGDEAEAILLYVHTGTPATSRLIILIDTGNNLPFTPNGGDVLIEWDNGADKIFRAVG